MIRGARHRRNVERSMHLAERKRLYEEMHPETKNGENQHTRKSLRKVCEPSTERFTADTAKKTGVSERKVQMDVSRGEDISEELTKAEAAIAATSRSTRQRPTTRPSLSRPSRRGLA